MSDGSLFALLGSYDNLSEPASNANKRETVLGVTITFLILSWTCGLFRFYTRLFVNYAPGWDDFFLLLVLLTGLMGAICICMLPENGLGQHFILLNENQMTAYLRGFYVANGAYIMSTTLIKISLLLQYLRVFREAFPRSLCYFLLILSSLWGSAFTIIAWLPCVPVYDFWNISLAESEKECFGYGSLTRDNFVETYLSHAGFNMTLDVLVLSMPIYLVFKKSDVSINRTGLAGLLFGGCIVVCISIWRLATLVEHRAATYPTFDPTWYSPISIILSAIEVDIASICASVPVFWPVLTDSLEGIFVTKEVRIIYEDRSDVFELHRTRPGSDGTLDQYSMDCAGRSLTGAPSRAASGSLDFKEEKTMCVRTHIQS